MMTINDDDDDDRDVVVGGGGREEEGEVYLANRTTRLSAGFVTSAFSCVLLVCLFLVDDNGDSERKKRL